MSGWKGESCLMLRWRLVADSHGWNGKHSTGLNLDLAAALHQRKNGVFLPTTPAIAGPLKWWTNYSAVQTLHTVFPWPAGGTYRRGLWVCEILEQPMNIVNFVRHNEKKTLLQKHNTVTTGFLKSARLWQRYPPYFHPDNHWANTRFCYVNPVQWWCCVAIHVLGNCWTLL